MNNNGNTPRWIAIIISIIIAFVSLSIGLIRTNQQASIHDIKADATRNQGDIVELKKKTIKVETDIGYLKERMDEINKKLDLLIKYQLDK